MATIDKIIEMANKSGFGFVVDMARELALLARKEYDEEMARKRAEEEQEQECWSSLEDDDYEDDGDWEEDGEEEEEDKEDMERVKGVHVISNVRDNNGNLVIAVSYAGYPVDNIKVKTEGISLVVTLDPPEENPLKLPKRRTEFFISSKDDRANITCTAKDGVLTINIPKKSEEVIEIKVE
ncbi:MAG TPA: Hsp20/alpha crystallin family protein [Candidatus Pacearchaeota archaeon]|nr:Hsp20/alpha crystallin family protein [Candidatus Pacearchaeota archaeon]HOS12864.1 Hsp20/alpha crystallin family protein [Candidatus Pacearchaeota archaeon]